MNKLIAPIFCLFCFTGVAGSQPKARLWLEWDGYQNLNFRNRAVSSFYSSTNNPLNAYCRFSIEHNLLSLTDRYQLYISGSAGRNAQLYNTFGGAGGRKGSVFHFAGGGLGIAAILCKNKFSVVRLINTCNWFYTNNDEAPAKVKHKNYLENNTGIEWTASLNNNKHLGSRITYNWQKDLKYPEPFYFSPLYTRFGVALGLGFSSGDKH
jgi:hypothetical protein